MAHAHTFNYVDINLKSTTFENESVVHLRRSIELVFGARAAGERKLF
jgi:hypothetical protein